MNFSAFATPVSTTSFTAHPSTVSSVCTRRPTLFPCVSSTPARWSAITQPINKTLMSPVPIPYSVPEENKKPRSDAPQINFNESTQFDPVLHKNSVSGNTNFHLDVLPDSPQSTIVFNGTTYYLKQLHLHAPAEHTLGDRDRDSEFPMEVHFVHNSSKTDVSGQFCVLGALIVKGGKNEVFGEIIEGIVEEIEEGEETDGVCEHDDDDGDHTHAGETNNLEQSLELDLPGFIGDNVLDTNVLVSYIGSLTTQTLDSNNNPSYLAGEVQWIMSKNVIKASEEQIDTLTGFMGAIGSARDLQPIVDHEFCTFVLDN